MVANISAIIPIHLLNVVYPNSLQASNAPTMVIPDMALEPDMRGVCSVGGTLAINSKPR